MVDAHGHVTGQGGAHWLERFADEPGRLVAVAEANGRAACEAGIRWLHDAGSPIGIDPVDGRERALALGVRDRWAERDDVPYLRAAIRPASSSSTATRSPTPRHVAGLARRGLTLR